MLVKQGRGRPCEGCNVVGVGIGKAAGRSAENKLQPVLKILVKEKGLDKGDPCEGCKAVRLVSAHMPVDVMEVGNVTTLPKSVGGARAGGIR